MIVTNLNFPLFVGVGVKSVVVEILEVFHGVFNFVFIIHLIDRIDLTKLR